MANPLSLFRRGDPYLTARLAIELDEELTREEAPAPSLIERQLAEVTTTLCELSGNKLRLEEEIAERQELLRQTEIAIRSFEAAAAILDEGKKSHAVEPPAEEREEIAPDPVERLVPRRAKS